MIKTKSVHDPIEPTDGKRILVSCFWPKFAERNIVDMWFPELGSELELIKNWHGQKFDWDYFRQQYLERLKKPRIQNILEQIAQAAENENITLVGHAKQSQHCQRTILKEYLDENFIYKTNRQ